MPDTFYRREVKMNEKRHLMDGQLYLLTQAQCWYIDGTFKVMRAPFIMLLTIHAFVHRGDCSKQVPLVFVPMSGRTTEDYEKVFKGIGLATEYMNDRGTYSLLRMLFCLPFLPAEHIMEVFLRLEEFNTAANIDPLFQYIRRTWLEPSTWSLENWSVFGWHRRLNVRTGVAPPLYTHVQLLHKEAMHVESQVRLVSEMRLRRLQRSAYRTIQARIFQAWDSYRANDISASGLLKKISSFYKPRVLRTEEGHWENYLQLS